MTSRTKRAFHNQRVPRPSVRSPVNSSGILLHKCKATLKGGIYALLENSRCWMYLAFSYSHLDVMEVSFCFASVR